MIRIIVCGGRDYDDRDRIYRTLSDIHAKRGPIVCVIHGAASGADLAAASWAQEQPAIVNGLPVTHQPFRPEWKKWGNAAGEIRNQRMLDEGYPDLVVAFPGGNGTADMVARAKRAGVLVIEVSASGELTETPAAERAPPTPSPSDWTLTLDGDELCLVNVTVSLNVDAIAPRFLDRDRTILVPPSVWETLVATPSDDGDTL